MPSIARSTNNHHRFAVPAVILLAATLSVAGVLWRVLPSTTAAAEVSGAASATATPDSIDSAAPAAPVAPAAPAPVMPHQGPAAGALADPAAVGLDHGPAPRAPRAPRASAPSGGSAPAPAPNPEPPPAPEPPPPAASPAPGAAGQVMSLLNGYRSANGLAPLSGAGDAMAKAQAHAEEMAAAGSIWHSNLASGIGSWSALAENVGVGYSASEVHNAFVASSGHRANMLGDFQDVGVGAAVGADGRLYVCEVFVAR